MKGRIVLDPLLDHRQVYLPSSTEDLSEALKKIHVGGLNPVVLQASVANTSSITMTSTDVHVDLTNFTSISPSGTIVTVGPATTIRSLVAFLKHRSLFLPLSHRPHDTVLDAIEDTSPGMFDRSVATLRSTVACITGVASDSGEIFKIDQDSVATKFKSALSPLDSSRIVTAISFKAMPATDLQDLWFARVPFLLFSPELPQILKRLSESDGEIAKHAKVDLPVTTLGALSYALPVAYITMAARDADHKPSEVLAALLPGVSAKVQDKGVYRGALATLSAVPYWYDAGSSTMTRHVWLGEKKVSSEEAKTLAAPTAQKETNKSPNFSHRGQVSLRVARAPGTNASAYVTALLILPKAGLRPEEAVFEKKVKGFFGKDGMKRVTRKEDIVPTVAVGSKPPSFKPSVSVHKVLGAANMVGSLDTTKCGPIPGFPGPMYMEGDDEYKKAEVYASSSYPDDRSQPYVVAYPQSILDIQLAILFAKLKGLKVVARSGGHQYSCLSSGGSSVVLLGMDYFTYTRHGRKRYHAAQGGRWIASYECLKVHDRARHCRAARRVPASRSRWTHSERWIRSYTAIHGCADRLCQVVPHCTCRLLVHIGISPEHGPSCQTFEGERQRRYFLQRARRRTRQFRRGSRILVRVRQGWWPPTLDRTQFNHEIQQEALWATLRHHPAIHDGLRKRRSGWWHWHDVHSDFVWYGPIVRTRRLAARFRDAPGQADKQHGGRIFCWQLGDYFGYVDRRRRRWRSGIRYLPQGLYRRRAAVRQPKRATGYDQPVSGRLFWEGVQEHVGKLAPGADLRWLLCHRAPRTVEYVRHLGSQLLDWRARICLPVSKALQRNVSAAHQAFQGWVYAIGTWCNLRQSRTRSVPDWARRQPAPWPREPKIHGRTAQGPYDRHRLRYILHRRAQRTCWGVSGEDEGTPRRDREREGHGQDDLGFVRQYQHWGSVAKVLWQPWNVRPTEKNQVQPGPNDVFSTEFTVPPASSNRSSKIA